MHIPSSLFPCWPSSSHNYLTYSLSFISSLITLRERVAHYTQDRFFAPDIECATALLAQGALQRLVPDFM
ncbi:hypothetical protein AAT49_06185 [Salmonella enterica]|nr:hypothetical protein [Salmonella enterica]